MAATVKRIATETDPTRTTRVSIHDVAFGGEGVGRVDGKMVFIPFTVDGEEVEATIVEHGNVSIVASLTRRLSPPLIEPSQSANISVIAAGAIISISLTTTSSN